MSEKPKLSEAIRELEAKATPGPWHHHDTHIHARYETKSGIRHYAVVDALNHGGMASQESAENVALIEMLRNNALPEIECLEAENERLKARLSEAETLLKCTRMVDFTGHERLADSIDKFLAGRSRGKRGK